MLYDSLREVCPDVPSRGYVESLMRLAALLHDVGHGPFGHFFDAHYLADYGLNHEIVGSHIIRHELGDLFARRPPQSQRPAGRRRNARSGADRLPHHPAAAAPTADDGPRWLRFLRSLFSGLYTVDNMDFVLRDAYMSGYSTRAFDLDRLLHYSLFTAKGLTIHERGPVGPGAVHRRPGRAVPHDLLPSHGAGDRPDAAGTVPREQAAPVSRQSAGAPRRVPAADRVVAAGARWPAGTAASDPALRALGERWQDFLRRRLRWKMACERTIFFAPGEAERSSVFSNEEAFEAAIREHLPRGAAATCRLRVDTARHVHRPGAQAPAAGQNFLFDPATGKIRSLDDRELFRRIAISYRICRIYAEDQPAQRRVGRRHGPDRRRRQRDDVTNM